MNHKAFLKEFNSRLNSLNLNVEYQYNPFEYAFNPACDYLKKYANKNAKAFLLGMNPGPFGMAQTGVPFGDVGFVRDWLGIESKKISKPEKEHPKRPIDGFDCKRSEVSGSRLWGWAKDKYIEPEVFFKKYFVWNYCPLCFMYESGKNLTPDKLSVDDRGALFSVCNWALLEMISEISPEILIGIGKFAEDRLNKVKKETKSIEIEVARILHPSPASPAANRGWQEQIEKQLKELSV